MKKYLFVATLLTACFAASAQQESEIRPLMPQAGSRAVQQQNLEYTIPQLILGGERTSTIKLTNRSAQPIPRTNVYFVDSNGSPMRTTFRLTTCGASGCVLGSQIVDEGFSFNLLVGGMLEVTFAGDSNTRFGYGVVDICPSGSGSCSSAGLYAEVTLRNRNPTRPDFESVFPLEQPTDLQYMLWDHRAGVSTLLYLVNGSTTASTVTLEFQNQAEAGHRYQIDFNAGNGSANSIPTGTVSSNHRVSRNVGHPWPKHFWIPFDNGDGTSD